MSGYQSNIPTSNIGLFLTLILTALKSSWRTQGNIDAGTSPPFPGGTQNDVYIIDGNGNLGADANGINGIDVNDKDILYCRLDNAGGTFQEVGDAWIVIPHKDLQP